MEVYKGGCVKGPAPRLKLRLSSLFISSCAIGSMYRTKILDCILQKINLLAFVASEC